MKYISWVLVIVFVCLTLTFYQKSKFEKQRFNAIHDCAYKEWQKMKKWREDSIALSSQEMVGAIYNLKVKDCSIYY